MFCVNIAFQYYMIHFLTEITPLPCCQPPAAFPTARHTLINKNINTHSLSLCAAFTSNKGTAHTVQCAAVVGVMVEANRQGLGEAAHRVMEEEEGG